VVIEKNKVSRRARVQRFKV